MPPCEMPRRLLPSSIFRWTNRPAGGKPGKRKEEAVNERLRPEQVTFYHENGFLGPIDLLSQDEVAEVRRHVEEVEESSARR